MVIQAKQVLNSDEGDIVDDYQKQKKLEFGPLIYTEYYSELHNDSFMQGP